MARRREGEKGEEDRGTKEEREARMWGWGAQGTRTRSTGQRRRTEGGRNGSDMSDGRQPLQAGQDGDGVRRAHARMRGCAAGGADD